MNYKNRSNKYKKNETVATIDYGTIFNITGAYMDLLIAYSMSENDHIHRKGLVGLKDIVEKINEQFYDNNQKELLKFRFLKRALELKVNGIRDRELIIEDINRNMPLGDIIKEPRILRELSKQEVEYCEDAIVNMAQNELFTRKCIELADAANGFRDADINNKGNALDILKNVTSSTLTELRKVESIKESSKIEFRLSKRDESVKMVHATIKSPSYKLVTGMQGINAMLGGGFEKQRVYAFFGMSGDGKSTTLENILYQLWKYNKGFITKDKTKKPCIVLLTMENFVTETVAALYSIVTRGDRLVNCETPEEAIKKLDELKFGFNDDNDIEIAVRFVPGNTQNTNYMYTLVENLEDEGYETIAFLQDYMGRINPVDRTNDSYQDLGKVIDEFKTFAMFKDIPVITAAQLNREAIRLIDEGRSNNKNNLLRKLNRSNIGESIKIDQNLDGGFIIAREMDDKGNQYMGFKLAKNRYEIFTNTKLIYQPFYTNSKGYVEDVYETRPSYKENIEASIPQDEFITRNNIRSEIASLQEGQTMKSALLDRQIQTMIRPNVIIEDHSKELYGINKNALVIDNINAKKLKEVIYIVPEVDRENYRDKYGVMKVL